MAQQSINLTDKLMNDYWQAHRVLDGESSYYNLPSYLNGLVSATGNGYFDPSNKQAIFAAIKANDPSGFSSIVNGYRDFFGQGSLTGTGPNDTLNYDYRDSGPDWIAPVAMTLAPFAGAAAAGGWGGAAAGASAAGGGAFGLGETALGLGGAASMATPAAAAVGELGGGSIPGMGLAEPWGVGAGSNLSTLAEGGLPYGAGESVLDTVAPAASGIGASGAALPAGWQTMLGVPGAATAGGVGGSAAAGLGGAVAGGSGAVSPAASAAAQSAISRILNGTATADDWLKILGSAAPGLIGAYAANKQTDAYKTLADTYAGYGAPYRQRLSDLYSDPSSFLKSPEVTTPVQQASDIMARSLSTQGNPAGSGNALQQLQSFSSDQLFGKLGQEKDRLAGFGGLSTYNAAAPSAATNVIGSSTKPLDALGAAASNIFNPPRTLAQQLSEFKTLSGAMA